MSVSDEDISALLNSELLERRTKVMFLRNAGGTWAKIAAECGVSEATVRKDYQVVCRDINNENPANVVARHRAVIYDIQRAMYPKLLAGDVKAATVMLKALHRESNLLGLDQPIKLMAAVSNEEFANEAAALIERINRLDPATMKELERATRRDTIIDAETEPEPAADPVEGAGDPVDALERTEPPGPRSGPADPEPDGRGDQAGPALPDPALGPAAEPAAEPDGQHVDPGLPEDDDDWSNI